MTLVWILSAVGFAFAMTASPGPNNMMVAGSGANFGLRRTVPHILGIAIGIVTVQFAIAMLGGALLGDPRVRDTLKWAGVAYILYLAWRTGTARPRAARGNSSAPMTFTRAALFQWINPKVWVAAGSAIVTFAAGVEGTSPEIAMGVLALIFGLVALPSSTVWTMIGAAAGRLLRSDRALRAFNVAMAALLVASLLPVIWH